MLQRLLCKPLQYLRSSDPGLLRLTQAFKTLAGVLIALDLFWRTDRATRLFAGMGVAFFMQCIPAGTRRRMCWVACWDVLGCWVAQAATWPDSSCLARSASTVRTAWDAGARNR